MRATLKKSLLILLATSLLATSGWSQSWLSDYNTLLATYRSESGIDYSAWKNNATDLQKLDGIVKALATQPPPDTNDATEIAYYTNAYNLLVLHGVLAETPLKSVKDIASNFGFFSQKRFTLGGEKVSLNEIEKTRLLKQFGDARIHFIVNCASTSCPPLPPVALTSENLETIMNTATASFLNQHPEGIRKVDERHYALSKLFDWYQGDFKGSSGSVLSFVNRYRGDPVPENARIRYLDYSWDLNQAN